MFKRSEPRGGSESQSPEGSNWPKSHGRQQIGRSAGVNQTVAKRRKPLKPTCKRTKVSLHPTQRDGRTHAMATSNRTHNFSFLLIFPADISCAHVLRVYPPVEFCQAGASNSESWRTSPANSFGVNRKSMVVGESHQHKPAGNSVIGVRPMQRSLGHLLI